VNPFDLPGPQFLAFYLSLALGTGFVLNLLLAGLVPRPVAYTKLTDPYALALARAGGAEVARLAIFSLIDRCLLAFPPGGRLRSGLANGAALVHRPLERALLELCEEPRWPSDLVEHSRVRAAVEAIEASLVRDGILRKDESSWRFLLGASGVALLGGVALVKLVVALGRGHANVQFLLIAAGVSCWAVIALARHRTPPRAVEDAQVLFGGLKERGAQLKQGGATAEATLLGAAYGLRELLPAFPYLEEVFPDLARRPGGGGGGGDGGSSCGSSCGGGCGGGCGGCGGG
jgi:uncharacterized protein (TIGR04222 family)